DPGDGRARAGARRGQRRHARGRLRRPAHVHRPRRGQPADGLRRVRGPGGAGAAAPVALGEELNMADPWHGHGGARGLRAPPAGAVPDAMRSVLRRYASLLPVTPATPALTRGDGSTPLLAAPRLAEWVAVSELFLKFEGVNPTGSFKDRGMVVAVAEALEEGRTTVLCASTGNTAASAAAYAARAGITAVVVLPRGKVAAGKLAQAVAYGARVVSLDANFDAALDLARELAERYPVALVNSVNPHRIEGQATAAYEICDALGDAPDVLALPVGNG